MILTIAKTPALTTATACSSALTGTGATIARGSQPCSGITAAFDAPNTTSSSSHLTCSSPMRPSRMPPGTKSSVPAARYIHTIAASSSSVEEPTSTAR